MSFQKGVSSISVIFGKSPIRWRFYAQGSKIFCKTQPTKTGNYQKLPFSYMNFKPFTPAPTPQPEHEDFEPPIVNCSSEPEDVYYSRMSTQQADGFFRG